MGTLRVSTRVHLIYHPNDRALIGVSMDHVAYMEEDHVAAAALMLHTMDELEGALRACFTNSPPSIGEDIDQH